MIVVCLQERDSMSIPYFIKPITGLLLFVLLLSCSPSSIPATTASFPEPENNTNSGSMENSILRYINRYRNSIGKGSLQILNAASVQAFRHSSNMANGRTAFSHSGFDQRIRSIEQSIGRSSASAENVAYGHLTAKGVVDVWLNSPGHKKNIEGNYNLTGIGVSKDREGSLYFTQIFLRK